MHEMMSYGYDVDVWNDVSMMLMYEMHYASGTTCPVGLPRTHQHIGLVRPLGTASDPS